MFRLGLAFSCEDSLGNNDDTCKAYEEGRRVNGQRTEKIRPIMPNENGWILIITITSGTLLLPTMDETRREVSLIGRGENARRERGSQTPLALRGRHVCFPFKTRIVNKAAKPSAAHRPVNQTAPFPRITSETRPVRRSLASFSCDATTKPPLPPPLRL